MINLEVPHVAKSLKWDLDWGSYPKMDALFSGNFLMIQMGFGQIKVASYS